MAVGPHFSQPTRKPVELADHISEDDCAIARHLPNITLAVFLVLMGSEKRVRSKKSEPA
jgi:hypothetical protein